MRGRPRVPTALKLLRGNPGHRPLPQNEPQPALGAEPPAWMDAAARQEWAGLAPMLERLGVLTEADAEALAELCTARAVLKGNLKDLGRFSTELWRAIQAMEARFGLTPADRARIKVERPKGPETKLGKYVG